MATSDKETVFAERVLHWFDDYGRKDLPWQQDISAYSVWVSEIMLQQTQVKTVIPYYGKFMQRFPDVNALAAGEEDEVLHYWSGLGYYSRARNLHRSARQVVENHGGEFPASVEALVELPGIGQSTAGAILSIAFQQRAPILDGNVKRVLARHYAVAGWPGQGKVARQLWQLAEETTPHERVADYTQAIMDLGATVCKRSQPDCNNCPVKNTCAALASQAIGDYPGRKPKKELPVKTTAMYILENPDGEILLEKRPASGIWGGLWSLPEDKLVLTNLDLGRATQLTGLRHTFSHFHLDITPFHYPVNDQPGVMDNSRLRWYNVQSPDKLGLAAPVRKLIENFRTLAREGLQQELI